MGGELSKDDTKKLIADVTDVLVPFFGENLRNNIWVIVQEMKTGNFGVGGQVIRLEDIKTLQAAKEA
jgi:4-oxalocrotonate tautomerase